MKITLLGTGTPTPSLKRMSSGYMVEVGDDVILFDHGPGSYHRLLEAGRKATDVTHVFFTHLHYDHCSDYVRLLLTRWDQGGGRIPELKVYGPPGIRRMTELLFSREGAFAPDLVARTEHELSVHIYELRGGKRPRRWPEPAVQELRSGQETSEHGWRVTTTSVVHVQPQLVCYGYRLDTAEASFVYSGDAGPCTAMEKLAADCDVLVHMCHFISGTESSPEFARTCMGHKDLAELGRKARVRNLVVSHVTEQMDVPGVRERLIREMTAVYPGNLFWGEDLMQIPIGDPRPMKLL
ncbi:MAG: MBL fold metallo-hydrolase [Alphaproteobacteria bacterium]|nr:MBL fold metallo-hydrolase [Alphaproteobacteria bacterium]